MPQMAPLLWSYLFVFFFFSLMLFLIMNYYISPFNKTLANLNLHLIQKKSWKL
uniref:ATP synthase F0 subunit 8 n=1 Tax=Tetralia glaberrima TaxID=652078 RepID=UPI0028D172E5|nr:ATP synthase F0 subunit 8 [Tetralia glaberrima]YP_010952725.1 ATP synthase F0 subunit 8 [Tetralia rubridactyla]YP_010952842.1 ATP synthase F0 subunit 8 [Tetralia nigrolineata]WMQ53093.1 ATP synthase F0 subunit 8 [Tetralia glaberrima]WMQ53145.1 ATP synthase F0 subunit 8 [Tetralia rubridactyla]WMQ53262.1 ATP synthase F0 subunit 8 [Tetralia nigrolineata]